MAAINANVKENKMTGLRKFSQTVNNITAILVGKRTAVDMKHSSRKMLGIKKRGRGRPRKS